MVHTPPDGPVSGIARQHPSEHDDKQIVPRVGLRIASSSNRGSRRFTAVQRVWTYVLEPAWTVLNCNRNCNSVMSFRPWRMMLAQDLTGDMADGNRNDHAVTTWLQSTAV